MNIERAEELLKKFKDKISHEPKDGLDDVLEWQDVIGNSSMKEITEFENNMSQERDKKHFVWVNFLTLSQDLAVDILIKTVIRRKTERIINDYEKDIQGREDALFDNEMKLQAAKKSIYKKIAALRKDKIRTEKKSEDLERRLTNTYEDNKRISLKATYSKSKARKFDELKAILAE